MFTHNAPLVHLDRQVRAAVLRRMRRTGGSLSPLTFASASDKTTLITAIERQGQELTAADDILQACHPMLLSICDVKHKKRQHKQHTTYY